MKEPIMGNSWGTPKKKGGGFYSEHPTNGTLYSGNTVNNGGRIDPSNHVHRHKDGVTVSHEGGKTSVVTRHCSYCLKQTKHVRKPGESYHTCVKCGEVA